MIVSSKRNFLCYFHNLLLKGSKSKDHDSNKETIVVWLQETKPKIHIQWCCHTHSIIKPREIRTSSEIRMLSLSCNVYSADHTDSGEEKESVKLNSSIATRQKAHFLKHPTKKRLLSDKKKVRFS